MFSTPRTKTYLLSLTLALASGTAHAQSCPATPDATSVPIANFDPPPLAGEPAMSVAGLDQFIKARGINSVAQLLSALPDHYQKRYAFIETTRGLGKASLTYPRIVLFGADARLLMNISTDPTDARYERLDVAFMNKDTGNWEFAEFNMKAAGAKLTRNPAVCAQCHGSPARPIWGTYLNWPGAIGDDPAPGDQAETLTARHAQRLTELKAGRGNPERFHTLKWAPAYQATQAHFLPDHAYGYALTVSNNSLGYTVAESVYLRMKKRFPERFAALREELLLLGYYARRTPWLTNAETQRIANLIASLGGRGNTVEDLFRVLGVDIANEFSLHRLANQPRDPGWNAGSGDLFGLLYMLVLHDLAQSDIRVRTILQSAPKGSGVYGIWGCPKLGASVWDSLAFRMTQGWKAKGAARQAVERVFYDVDVSRSYQPIFEQAGRSLFEYLRTKISTTVP
jgi:hypothetical protein